MLFLTPDKLRHFLVIEQLLVVKGFGIDGMGSGDGKVDLCFPFCRHDKIVNGQQGKIVNG
jgi:hypothetical protein